MTLSSAKRLQTAARVERLETLIERQDSRLRLARSMGWPTDDLERLLGILRASHEMFQRRLSGESESSIAQPASRRKHPEE